MPNMLFADAIAGYVREQGEMGATIKEIAEACHGNYFTTRNYVMGLIKEGKIEAAPFVREKSTVYRNPDTSLSPKIKDGKGNRGHLAYYATAAVGLTKLEADIIMPRYHLAAAYYEACRDRPGRLEITKDLRTALIRARKACQVLEENFATLLNTDRLYTEQGWQDMVIDPDHRFDRATLEARAEGTMNAIRALTPPTKKETN